MKAYDVTIIGAGPAGAATAISLARRGYSAALIDKEKFPRDKLCGDFINPINWPIFRELGVESDIARLPHEKVTVFRITACSGEEAQVPLSLGNRAAPFALGVRRSSLDYVLWEKAAREGVAVFDDCRVRELRREASRWVVEISAGHGPEQLSAPLLIGADGRNSWVAHHLGMSRAAQMRGRSVGYQLRIATRCHLQGEIGIHLFPGGYAGLVGLGDGTINLGLAIDKRWLPRQRQAEFVWKSCLPQNHRLKEILARSEPLEDTRSTYPVYFKPRRSVADGVLLVGDAARVTEPVSGEGMYYAMKSGQLAAATVHRAFCRGDVSAKYLRQYEHDCRRVFRLRRSVNQLMQLLVYRPALLTPLIRLSAKQNRLLGSLVRSICAPATAD